MVEDTAVGRAGHVMKPLPEAAAEEAFAALARISLFGGTRARDLRVEPLGGLTNRNFKVVGPAGCYVLRLAGAGSDAFIDRAAETRNARTAAHIGVGAEIVHADVREGTLVARFIDGAVPMDAGRMREPGAIDRAAAVMRRLHGCAVPFASDVDPFAKIDDYLGLAHRGGAPLPAATGESVAAIAAIRRVIEARPVTPVPCHFDPTPANFLDTGSHMYLIDYEYAGNGDPMWDLAYLAVEAEFTPEQEHALLAAYLGGPPGAPDSARVALYKPACDLLAGLWSALRAAADIDVDEFRLYAENRLDRCRKRLASAELPRHVEALRRG